MRAASLLLIFASLSWTQEPHLPAFHGRIRTASGTPASDAVVTVQGASTSLSTRSGKAGDYQFDALPQARYRVSVTWNETTFQSPAPISLPVNEAAEMTLTGEHSLQVAFTLPSESKGTGGEDLAAQAVSGIPLNKRDFSQLLLLAAGTMTDANGATNFTAQFAVNGQRGVEAVFAMDGADSSDPEMGGATFSNFNVDAVSEIQSFSGWMPAEIGRGAAGFTNILTRSGSNALHGSVFEFVRNSAFDARNFFDRHSVANPGRIPPFRRNEFGVTLGGPVILPRIYDGRDRTFFYLQFQGFRQVLGTTQVLPVPTLAERQGINTTAFPGDTLLIPVAPQIQAILNRYPLPNDARGPFGARTFATSSKVTTNADQFSARLDHRLSSKDSLVARLSFNNLNGPTTNPNQTAIDQSFGILYVDHQRNGVVTWTHTGSRHFTSETSLSVTRTTPSFNTPNRSDPALTFSDGLYEGFNIAGGSVVASFGNLYQGRQNFTWTRERHNIRAGGEFRANRDSTYFGTAPNGSYTFGGGTAYSPVNVRSLSGNHNLNPGDALPDTLTALLTGSAFAYSIAVAPPSFPQGDQIGVAAASRYGLNLYAQDTWKISNRLQLDYGLRYELYTPFSERAKRSAGVAFRNNGGALEQDYLINPQPIYQLNANGWGPRVRVNWLAAPKLQIRAGAGLTTIPPNIWQDNLLTGAAPYVDYPRLTAAAGAPLLFGRRITPAQLPGVYSPAGVDILGTAKNDSKAVPANTVWDITRFARDLAALSPNKQIAPLNVNAMSQDFRNSYLATWTLALERQFGSLSANAGYVGTAGISLPAINFPNAYPGATPAYAPFTQFDSSGQPTGGFGTEMLMTNRSHSSYHALQASLQGPVAHGGPSIQASYTWAKSLDDDSTVIGGFVSGGSGASAQAWPQDPFNTRAEKAPSTFDIRQAFTLSAVQDLPFQQVPGLRILGKKATGGWQLLSVVTLTGGSPFTIYSGVQQTGAGSNGVDRPDQIGTPTLSTSRTIREDYFGRGAANGDFFSIPVNLSGGSGPNNGRFGTLGRNTLRGPAFYNFDFALIKNTSLGNRGSAELANLQFRLEAFNLFNLVNFGLPTNTILGSGFGQINRTAGSSRQVQFSLKLMF